MYIIVAKNKQNKIKKFIFSKKYDYRKLFFDFKNWEEIKTYHDGKFRNAEDIEEDLKRTKEMAKSKMTFENLFRIHVEKNIPKDFEILKILKLCKKCGSKMNINSSSEKCIYC